MTVEFDPGRNLFGVPNADAIVCTVNCVGVMGKGVALQVKQLFPKVVAAYQENCRKGILRPSDTISILTESDPPRIFMLATKDHWRNPSKPQWVIAGIATMSQLAESLQCKRVAMTYPGCGNGGLRQEDIKPFIVKILGPSRTHFVVCG